MSDRKKMAPAKEKPERLLRGAKTAFFLVALLFSLLLFSAPVLLAVVDAVLPSALLSVSLFPLSAATLASHLHDYDFRASLVDIPLISIARSIVILCVYCLCDGRRLSHGPYLAVTSLCSLITAAAVSLKACVFGGAAPGGESRSVVDRENWVVEAMFLCSLALSVGHVATAYRTCRRERRKMHVYKIDLEAVSACKKGFLSYHKILQQ